MAGRVRSVAANRITKGNGRQVMQDKQPDPYDPRNPDEDPYRDLRVHDEEPHDPASDEYIWPEYEEEDDD
jgi:hypothetical protein